MVGCHCGPRVSALWIKHFPGLRLWAKIPLTRAVQDGLGGRQRAEHGAPSSLKQPHNSRAGPSERIPACGAGPMQTLLDIITDDIRSGSQRFEQL